MKIRIHRKTITQVGEEVETLVVAVAVGWDGL
jgi:hypothetical protein